MYCLFGLYLRTLKVGDAVVGIYTLTLNYLITLTALDSNLSAIILPMADKEIDAEEVVLVAATEAAFQC